MNRTNIDYADYTWNPITGCTNAFPCRNYCWARKFAARMASNPAVKHRERYKDFRPAFWPERLDEPLSVNKPSRIAVSFMGDMFCKGAENKWIEKVFARMLDSDHTYLVLTKQPKRMAELVSWLLSPALLPTVLERIWLGTTITNQAEADERIPELLKCSAAVRWLSIEPMNGPIDHLPLDGIHWVVVGGGPEPMHPDWARSVRDQCRAANVSFYLKQLTENRRRIAFINIPKDLQIREIPNAG